MRALPTVLGLLLTCLGLVPSGIAVGAEGSALQLTLPPRGYAVAGQETSVVFDNLVLTEHPEDYEFVVTCKLGRADQRRWSATPGVADVGDHPWHIAVQKSGRKLAEGEFTLTVVAADAGAARPLSLLMVGDSLTHATLYPNEVARLLALPGNPAFRLLGTHRPGGAKAGVAHEGYGGWTWERFARHYEPDATAKIRSSPFVFLTDGQPQLDVGRYVREHCEGTPPTTVTFLLGINDCFGANPEDPAAIDHRVDEVLKHAELLLAEFRKAAPDADLGVCLTTPPNAREAGFEANYQGRYHRWGWKRIQHRLVQREIQQFAGREQERIFVVPTELAIDPVEGYPENNGVHPNAKGYEQIAGSIYAWLKWRALENAAAQ